MSTDLLLPSRNVLREAISRAFSTHEGVLGREITDEQAVPSYLRGWALSRAVFWGKLKPIVRAANVRPGEAVFDFGCGTGILLPTWVGRGARVWATDLHLEMARHVARELVPGQVDFVASDAWCDAIPDGSLDAVVAANVLEHIEDRPALYSTLRRKLKPCGRFVVSGPTENSAYRFGRALIGFTGEYHVTTIDDLLREVAHRGFRQTWLHRYPLPGPACLYRVARFEPEG